jgi:hypothetical protein
MKRIISILAVAVCLLAVCVVVWSLDRPAAAEPVMESLADRASAQEAVVGPEVERPGRPCKPCKDRPWCECTYNGHPRISCDPCCYDAQPYPICFD